MEKFMMRYPGDPPVSVVKMTRAEFLILFPRRPITLSNLSTGETESIPMAEDEICCDFCNGDPGGTVFVLGAGLRGYCQKCYGENWKRYCTWSE